MHLLHPPVLAQLRHFSSSSTRRERRGWAGANVINVRGHEVFLGEATPKALKARLKSLVQSGNANVAEVERLTLLRQRLIEEKQERMRQRQRERSDRHKSKKAKLVQKKRALREEEERQTAEREKIALKNRQEEEAMVDQLQMTETNRFPEVQETEINGLPGGSGTVASTPSLTHVNSSGKAHMVSVSGKQVTRRIAISVSKVLFSNPDPYDAIAQDTLKKGDVLATARTAGIMASKKCSELIPLCHPIMLNNVSVDCSLFRASKQFPYGGVAITAVTETAATTGVEMEALTSAQMAAVTVYDMCKAIDKHMELSGGRVVLKTGGKSGDWCELDWLCQHAGLVGGIFSLTDYWKARDSLLALGFGGELVRGLLKPFENNTLVKPAKTGKKGRGKITLQDVHSDADERQKDPTRLLNYLLGKPVDSLLQQKEAVEPQPPPVEPVFPTRREARKLEEMRRPKPPAEITDPDKQAREFLDRLEEYDFRRAKEIIKPAMKDYRNQQKEHKRQLLQFKKKHPPKEPGPELTAWEQTKMNLKIRGQHIHQVALFWLRMRNGIKERRPQDALGFFDDK